jgi:hypothetical protein
MNENLFGMFLFSLISIVPVPAQAVTLIQPPQPTTVDDVAITVSGEFGNPCFEIFSSHVVGPGLIEVNVEIIQLPGICIQVVTSWSVTEEIGELPAGDYHAIATIDAPCCFPCNPPPCVEEVSFSVEEEESVPVALDLKPGSDVNPINLISRSVIPVAILGSDTFDVTDVDATTLAFGPGGAAPMHKKSGHFKDANHDGIEDLLSHYRTGDSGIAIGDEEACITGETLDGEAFEGCDTVETFAPPGSQP